MATSPQSLAYVLEQVADAGPVRARKMFGEYGLFLDGKMVALVCKDVLFVKPTTEGRQLAAGLAEARPFPRAKPYILVGGEHLEDREFVSALVRRTAAALPAPVCPLKAPRP